MPDVTISGELRSVDRARATPVELLRAFDYDPNRYALYRPGSDAHVPEDEVLDLRADDEFDAIPGDTSYGQAPGVVRSPFVRTLARLDGRDPADYWRAYANGGGDDG